MAFTTATVLILKVVAAWILVQWVSEVFASRTPVIKPVITFMRTVNAFVVTAGTTFCALLVLLPSVVFVVLEVFGYVQSQSLPQKSISDYMARGVRIMNELEVLGERMRQAAASLNQNGEEAVLAQAASVEVTASETLPQTCGNVLLAVCRHSESMERLHLSLQPPEVDELIYCDCDDFEIRGEKVISLIGKLRECMERQTEVVQAVDALCPMIPVAPNSSSEADVDDSGFIEC